VRRWQLDLKTVVYVISLSPGRSNLAKNVAKKSKTLKNNTRERSNIIRRFREGLLKPSECRHIGEGVWPNRNITFIAAKKA